MDKKAAVAIFAAGLGLGEMDLAGLHAEPAQPVRIQCELTEDAWSAVENVVGTEVCGVKRDCEMDDNWSLSLDRKVDEHGSTYKDCSLTIRP